MKCFPKGCLVYQYNNAFVRPIRVRGVIDHQVQGTFAWSANRKPIAFNPHSIARLHLPGGCQVRWLDSSNNEQFGVIELRETDGDGLWSYKVIGESTTGSASEQNIVPVDPPPDDPISLLKNLKWSGVGLFARRTQFQAMRQRWVTQTQGMPGILGARIRPLPHQLAAVRRVLGEGSPRFLLADEVGLGKTIEAGLALKALLHREPSLRVLVIAPGAMGRQWLAELYLRFGAQVFTLLDQGVLQGLSIDEAESRFSQTLASSRVIVSASLLTEQPNWLRAICETSWDAVVVDEVHRYPVGTSLNPFVARLARESRIFLALSATPSSNDLAGLQDLLRLVNPASDVVPIERQLSNRREIWFAVHNTRQLLRPSEDEQLSPDELSEVLESLWKFADASDTKIGHYIKTLREKRDLQYAWSLLGYVQERYRMDQRLVRSRREWVTRNGEPLSIRRLECLLATTHEDGMHYVPDPAERELTWALDEMVNSDRRPHAGMLRAVMERLCLLSPSLAVETLNLRKVAIKRDSDFERAQVAFRRLFDEPEPVLERDLVKEVLRLIPPVLGELERLDQMLNWALFWQKENPVPARFVFVSDWISNFWLQKPGASVLVFAQDSWIVKEISNYFSIRFGKRQVDEFHAERSPVELEAVARAFQTGALKILVSDELGGEGRNFQHAEAVIHVDLPWSPGRVEQRIGRLDRIGRSPEKEVLSVVLCGPSKLELSIFKMLRETFCVFEKTIGPIEFRMTGLRDKLSQAVAQGPTAVEEMQSAIASAISAAREEDEEVLDAALQLSQDELDEGKVLAHSMKHVPWQDWQATASGWARELGMTCDRQVDDVLRVQLNPEQMQVEICDVNPLLRAGIFGTFSRKRALRDESIHLFGPGHPFVEALESLVDKSWLGRACVWKRNLGSANGRVYALFNLVYEPDFKPLKGQTNSATVELAVLRHYQPGTAFVALAMPNRSNPNFEIVGQEVIRNMLRLESSIGQMTFAELTNLGTPGFPYRLMQSIEEARLRAVEHLRRERVEITRAAVERFHEATQIAVDVLRDRIESNECMDRAQLELEAWTLASNAILEEKIIVDSVQVIFTPRNSKEITQ